MTAERIGTLMVWQGAGAIWRYLPLSPTPQRNEAGRANVTVMDAGGMVMLTIGARLQADEAELAAARKLIAGRAGLSEAQVDLRPAEASVTAASLRLIAPGHGETELATARPSNLPPYATAFSAMLQGDRAAAVKAALPAGRVVVRYEVALPRTLAASAGLSGPWDGTGSVEDALARGDLELRTARDAGASEALFQRVVDKAKAEAGSARPKPAADDVCAPGARRSATFAEVIETEIVEERLSLEAGIAGWMK
jgi:hypothetical protein